MSDVSPDSDKTLAELVAEHDAKFVAYHSALGEFISAFSSVEWNINNLVRHYSKTSRNTLNILLGPLRMDNGLDVLNRLKNAGTVAAEEISELEEITAQLRKINRLRNDVVHYGISWHQEGFAVSNKFYAYKNKETITHIISPDTLLDAALDLTMIHARIGLLMDVRMRSNPPYGHLLREPWRYLPRLLDPHGLPRQLNSRRRKIRPQASRA